MSTVFSYQILTYIEAIYVGCSKPSDLDKSGRWSMLFTSFINTTDRVLNPQVAAEVISETLSIKLDPATLQSLLPILKAKSLYRLVLGIRDWSMNGRSGISYRLIDISQLNFEESIFKGYLGKLKDVSIDSSIEIPQIDPVLEIPSKLNSESLQQFMS